MIFWLLMKHRVLRYDVGTWITDEGIIEGAYSNHAEPAAIATRKNKRSSYVYKVKKITVKGNNGC